LWAPQEILGPLGLRELVVPLVRRGPGGPQGRRVSRGFRAPMVNQGPLESKVQSGLAEVPGTRDHQVLRGSVELWDRLGSWVIQVQLVQVDRRVTEDQVGLQGP
jgi:hypothetical protein